jgi:hypothetical protein
MSFLMRRKKGAGVGRVFAFASIANQPHALENKYVPGSGVGASSISTRRALSRRATIVRSPSFTVGNRVTKDMRNRDYDDEFDPNNFPLLFPDMEPFIPDNIVAGDKGEDRLLASQWRDLGDDVFDDWGFFYLYDVNSGKYYFPLINPQNGDDGVIYTQIFNAFERTFTIKHGWAAQGIFKFDISVADSLPFRFGAYGNIDNDYVAESLTHNYSIGGQNKTLYYYDYNVPNEDPGERFYFYWIPKTTSENSAQTYDVYYDGDDMSMRSKVITTGLIVYFAKTNDVKDWVINDLGSLLS